MHVNHVVYFETLKFESLRVLALRVDGAGSVSARSDQTKTATCNPVQN